MYGGNYFGKPYYGQGSAETEIIQFKVLTATVSLIATLTSTSIINKILTATVELSATALRMAQKTVTATVTVAAFSVSGLVVKALNVVRGVTKLLTPILTTRDLRSERTTAGISTERKTRQIQVRD